MTTNRFYSVENGKVINEGVQDGEALIQEMVKASMNLSNYSAEYEMKVFKEKRVLEESGIFYFRKPRLLRSEVKEGSRKGSLAILAGDGKVHGHMGGMLKYFTGSVGTDSEYAKALNGYPMAGTDFYSLAAYLENMLKEGNLSLSTVEAVSTISENRLSYILDMYSGHKGGPELLLKRVYVDPKTYLPHFWQDYKESKLWSESSWKNFHSNLSLSDKLFQP